MSRPTLAELLRQRVLVLDGATGTRLQQETLTAADFGGAEHEGCYEALVLHRPELVEAVHREYLAAGADIVETNTFGGTPLVLAEFGLAERAREINRRAAEIARAACDAAEAADAADPALAAAARRPRFVAGSIGPSTKSILLTGGVTFDQLADHFRVQALGLIEGGADYLLVETVSDPVNAKATFCGIDDAFAELGLRIPVALSVTVEASGVTLCGQSAEAFYTTVEQRELLYFGLNCAVGPSFMADPIRSLAAIAECPIACVPNAGLPDENGRYAESPEQMAAVFERFLAEGWLNAIGGCCGTTAPHVRAFATLAPRFPPRVPLATRWGRVSGIEYLSLEEDRRPLQVGERTNVIGSRKFKRLVAEGDFERAAELGRGQVAAGAHILDVCLADPDRDEAADTSLLLDALTRMVRVPLMIDSTDPAVIEAALKKIPGKPIVNSVNLEDGEERFERIAPLAHRYGAALVVGTIDEDRVQGMALTAERKLAVARREYELLTGKYGLHPTDLIFDPLVFPCASGDVNYKGSARETIEGVRAIKQHLPGVKTLLGVSNVSFGLPPAGREVLNSVFLHECVEAGLDLAIVNSEKLVRYAQIPEEEREAALDLLYDRGEDPIARFTALFREERRRQTDDALAKAPIEMRLSRRIVEARREGLEDDLEEALSRYAPLDVINGPLLDGMGEVGRLFGNNELIVAEVLQSAEVMKAAVSYLERYMEPGAEPQKGTVVLATVKGDVHDIGKNLVSILFANNGFGVKDLGIKVDPVTLARAIEEHRPAIVGLSGLLVKSAQQMAVTAADLKAMGIAVPVLCGGAALTRKFTETRIAPAYDGIVLYAKDAMDGLALANRIVDPRERPGARRRARPRHPEGPRLRAPLPGSERAGNAGLGQRPDALRPAPGGEGERPRRARRREREAGLPEGTGNGTRARGAGRGLAPAARRLPLPPGRERRRRAGAARAARRAGGRALRLPAPARPRAALHRGLGGARGRPPRQRGALRRVGRQRRARAGRGAEAAGRVPALARPRGDRPGTGRGDGRVAARPAAHRLGDPRPSRADAVRDVPHALPRPARLVRLPGLPGARGSGDALPPARAGEDRRPADRRLHDGPGGVGVGARVPPPGGALLRGRMSGWR